MCSLRTKRGLLVLAGVLALGVLAVVWAAETGSSRAQEDALHDCPQPGKWAISVWSGEDGTDAEEAFATCGEGAVAAAYSLDRETQEWSRWFAGQEGFSDLTALNNMQGVVALGGAGAPSTPTPTLTPTAAGGSPTAYLETFHAALDVSAEMDGLEMEITSEGDFEAPDSFSCHVSAIMLDLPVIEEHLIVIGNEAWIDTGDGWRETTPSDPEVVETAGICPSSPSFWEDFSLEGLPLLGESETKNGVPAIHYSVAEPYEAFAGLGLIPEGLEGVSIEAFDVWLAEDGYWPVSVEIDMSMDAEAIEELVGMPLSETESLSMAMSIDITQANDPSIQVTPP